MFSEIEHVSDWGEWEELEGRALKHNDRVEIQWADGSTSPHTISTRQKTDRGARDEITTTWSFVKVQIHGQTCEVLLEPGMRARRL